VANADVTVPGARRGDFADASLDTSSIAFILDCHVWSNDKVRVTARNVSLSTVDLPAAALRFAESAELLLKEAAEAANDELEHAHASGVSSPPEPSRSLAAWRERLREVRSEMKH
jgi:hypothetical protein